MDASGPGRGRLFLFSKYFWPFVLVALLVAVWAIFSLSWQQLVQRVNREAQAGVIVLNRIPRERRMTRNLSRWRDSSLIFATLNSQLRRGFPPGRADGLFNAWDDLMANGNVVITIQPQFDGGLSAAALPALSADLNEDHFHVWPGFICAADPAQGYLKDDGGLIYEQVVEGSRSSQFAVVYAAERLGPKESNSNFIKCLDSLHGFDSPDFVFEWTWGPE